MQLKAKHWLQHQYFSLCHFLLLEYVDLITICSFLSFWKNLRRFVKRDYWQTEQKILLVIADIVWIYSKKSKIVLVCYWKIKKGVIFNIVMFLSKVDNLLFIYHLSMCHVSFFFSYYTIQLFDSVTNHISGLWILVSFSAHVFGSVVSFFMSVSTVFSTMWTGWHKICVIIGYFVFGLYYLFCIYLKIGSSDEGRFLSSLIMKKFKNWFMLGKWSC